MKVVEINEFMKYLKANDLVIVSASEFQANKQIELNILRDQLLKKPSVCLHDIVRAKLLPYTTKQGIKHAIDRGDFKPGEWYQETKGKKRIMIMVEAIKKRIQ